MIIKSFHLEAFGPFTDTSLEFDPLTPGLHIVYGPNESGKSSTLRALKAWLFGFPERTLDNFFHPNDKLCVSGTLSNSHGDELSFSRRKKRKASVLDPNGNVIDSGQIMAWLQGLDKDAFEVLFCLDHTDLVQGGTSLLQEKGSAGTTLFSAGTGIASLQQILNELREEKKVIFKQQGSKPELNSKLKRYQDLKTELKKATLSSHTWKEQEKALKQAESELEKIKIRKKEIQEEEQRLTRLQQALKPLGRLRKAQTELEQLSDLPSLPDDFAKTRQEYQELLRQSEKTLTTARKRLEEDQAKIKAIEVNTDLLDQEDTIQDLHQRLGVYRKGKAELQGLKEKRIQKKASAAEILRRVRPDLEVEQVFSLRPLLKQRKEILAYASKLDLLNKEYEDSKDFLKSKQEELEKHKAELAKLPQDVDITRLCQAIEEVTTLGDIDSNLENQMAEAKAQKRDFKAGLLQLGIWQGSPEDLLNLPLPLESKVRQFKQKWEALEREGQDLARKRDELSSIIFDLEKKLQAQKLAGDLPSEEDLQAKRAWRDKGWSLLRRKWLDGEDLEAEIRDYAQDADLTKVYEDSVQLADHIADRLRWESSRVHENAQLQSELLQARTQWEEIENLDKDLSARWKELQLSWVKAWEPSKIEPENPEVMADWQAKLNSWRVTAKQIIELENIVSSLNQKQKEARSLLESALEDIGLSLPQGNTLSPILSLAKKTKNAFEQTAQNRQTLLEAVNRLKQEVEQANERVRQADEDLKAWQEKWGEYLLLLGLPSTETPSGVTAFFDELDACLNHMSKVDGYTEQIKNIEQESQTLKQDVQNLLQRVAPELLDQPLDQAVEGLNALLNRAQTDQASLKHYQESINKTEQEIQQAESDYEYAANQLKRLCDLAGCDEPEGLEAIENKWRKKQELEKDISTEKTRLREIAPAHSLDDIAAEVDSIDQDKLPGRLQEVKQELESLDKDITEKSGLVGELRKGFREMDGGDYAAKKAEEAEEVLAAIHRQADRFIRLRLAEKILEEAIEQYRAENQDPVLALAGDYFQELTLGSFTGLRADLDDKGEQIIVGLRDSKQRVSVEGMSDGTRDQLFLALRLASLEHRLEKSEPIPFIVDDILINFDQERTRAALRALERLGKRNQILLFSHHQQVADAGEGMELSQVHNLG